MHFKGISTAGIAGSDAAPHWPCTIDTGQSSALGVIIYIQSRLKGNGAGFRVACVIGGLRTLAVHEELPSPPSMAATDSGGDGGHVLMQQFWQCAWSKLLIQSLCWPISLPPSLSRCPISFLPLSFRNFLSISHTVYTHTYLGYETFSCTMLLCNAPVQAPGRERSRHTFLICPGISVRFRWQLHSVAVIPVYRTSRPGFDLKNVSHYDSGLLRCYSSGWIDLETFGIERNSILIHVLRAFVSHTHTHNFKNIFLSRNNGE